MARVAGWGWLGRVGGGICWGPAGWWRGGGAGRTGGVKVSVGAVVAGSLALVLAGCFRVGGEGATGGCGCGHGVY